MKSTSYILGINLVLVFLNQVTAAQLPALEEVVVVGSKIERPLWSVAGQVDILDRDTLDAQQMQEFAEISRYLPALESDFSGSRFGSTGVSIRGVGGNRVAFEFDGVPLPQQIDVGSFADSSRLALDPNIIKRTEILRGPASVLYGSDAIAGVVVLSSMDGKDLVEDGRQTYLGAKAGYFSESNSRLAGLTWAWAGKRDSLLATFSRRDGQELGNQSRNIEDDRLNYGQWQFFTKWTHDFDNGASLRTSFDYFQRDVDSDLRAQLGFERFRSTTKLQGEDQQLRKRITVRYNLPELTWLDSTKLNFYWQENDTEQFTDQSRSSRGAPVFLERDFFFNEQNYGMEFTASRGFDTASVSHIVVAGFEWDRQELRESRDAVQTNLLTGVATKSVLGEVFPLRDLPRTTSDKVGIYLQDEINFANLTLIPALRWDHYKLDANTDAIFPDSSRLTDLSSEDLTLRLGATWRLTDSVAIYGHYSEGFRAPPAEDVNLFLDISLFNFRAIPNPELKPERSRNLEAGLRLQSDTTLLQAGAYYSDYDNFIESKALIGVDPTDGALVFQSRNLEEASIYGVEVNLNQSLKALSHRLSDWHLDAGFHWAHGNNETNDRALNSVSPLKAVLGLRWQPQTLPLSATLRATHYGSQSRVDFSGGEFFVPGAATVADLVIDWRQSSQLQWYLGVYNITDARYWRYADTRRLQVQDPRVEQLSRPGVNASLTMHFSY